jgi:hypothetical protein
LEIGAKAARSAIAEHASSGEPFGMGVAIEGGSGLPLHRNDVDEADRKATVN